MTSYLINTLLVTEYREHRQDPDYTAKGVAYEDILKICYF